MFYALTYLLENLFAFACHYLWEYEKKKAAATAAYFIFQVNNHHTQQSLLLWKLPQIFHYYFFFFSKSTYFHYISYNGINQVNNFLQTGLIATKIPIRIWVDDMISDFKGKINREK